MESKEIEELIEGVYKNIKTLYPENESKCVIAVIDEKTMNGKILGRVNGETLIYAIQSMLEDNEILRDIIISSLISE